MFVGIFTQGSTVRFLHQTRNGSNVPTDATGNVAYRIYELPSETPLLTGNASLFDDDDTTGVYLVSFSASGGSGFDKGASYVVRVADTTSGDAHAELYTLLIV